MWMSNLLSILGKRFCTRMHTTTNGQLQFSSFVSGSTRGKMVITLRWADIFSKLGTHCSVRVNFINFFAVYARILRMLYSLLFQWIPTPCYLLLRAKCTFQHFLYGENKWTLFFLIFCVFFMYRTSRDNKSFDVNEDVSRYTMLSGRYSGKIQNLDI